jgi:hypothetical protein
MTIISTAYDTITALIGTTLGNTWVRLTNPDELSQNFDSFLRGGWGIIVDSTVNTNRELCGRKSFARSFSIVLCVEYFGGQASYTEQDDSIKKILEASTSVSVAIESDVTLAIAGGKAIASFQGDSGIVPIELDDRKFITCALNVIIETFI